MQRAEPSACLRGRVGIVENFKAQAHRELLRHSMKKGFTLLVKATPKGLRNVAAPTLQFLTWKLQSRVRAS